MRKINFGCGTNRLEGWQNYDAEVDITKTLPFGNGVADFVFAEHVVEHVTYEQALAFFRECHRILKSGGVVRIAVPSIERVMRHGNEDYFKFASRWTDFHEVSRRAAMGAILHAHGHQAPWTDSLLRASLYLSGFTGASTYPPGQSGYAELVGVEGHGKVIGDEFNFIETTVCEGIK